MTDTNAENQETTINHEEDILANLETSPKEPEQEEPKSDEEAPKTEAETHKKKADADDDDIYGLEEEASDADVDEYGNEKPSAKTYTEDEVNQRINEAVRERLSRLERNNTSSSQQQQMQEKAQQDFDYDPNSGESWQQQLETFVEQTYNKMFAKQAEQQRNLAEQRAKEEYEAKFHQGMSRFSDFNDVVGKQPISDAMVYASRGMKDPAAFFYAASKRNPEELQRISRIPDAYAQMLELGRLEERMKKQKAPTRAPRPVDKTKEDATQPQSKKNDRTGDDILANADAIRLERMTNRR